MTGDPLRRPPNQIPELLEVVVRQLLSTGWKKSHIAKGLRLNRRTVMRIARQNAQNQVDRS
jgi:hypothetical protein